MKELSFWEKDLLPVIWDDDKGIPKGFLEDSDPLKPPWAILRSTELLKDPLKPPWILMRSP